MVSVLGVVALGMGAVLMLADRAPGALRRVSDRLDAPQRLAPEVVQEVAPASDALVHIVVWGSIMVLVGLVAWSWRALAVGTLGVLVVATMFELAQGSLTSTRRTELSDLLANVVGIAIGLSAVAIWAAGWRVLSGMRSRRPQEAPT